MSNKFNKKLQRICEVISVPSYSKNLESDYSKKLKLLNDSLVEYVKFPPSYINYSRITDDLLELSGATCTYITILNKDKTQATLESMSGKRSNIQQFSSLIGFDPIGSRWKINEEYLEQMRAQKLMIRPMDNTVLTSRIPIHTQKYLKEVFNLDDIWSIGLFYHEELLGGIFMLFPPGTSPAKSTRM